MTDAVQPPDSSRPVAVITGASTGLGRAFAAKLAELGHDLVVIARNEAHLNDLAEELRAAHGTNAEILVADLSTPEGREKVSTRLALGVDILVNNAGYACAGKFWEGDTAPRLDELAVNVIAVMELTHAALAPMLAAGQGRIINVASISGLLSGPGNTYSADKAWVVKFSEGLAHHLAPRGVQVQALCPGFMRTPFHDRARNDIEKVPEKLWLDVDQVVDHSLASLEKGWAVSVPGRRYWFLTTLDRIKPRRFAWLVRP